MRFVRAPSETLAFWPARRVGQNARVSLGARTNLIGYLLALDRHEAACALVRDVLLERDAAYENEAFVAIAVDAAALAIAIADDLDRAARLAGFTEAVFARVALEREYNERSTRLRLDRLLAAGLGPHDLASAVADGAAMSADDAVRLALDSQAMGGGD